MLGGANGAHPGRVVEFNKNLQIVTEHPSDTPEHGFNPHGISVRPEIDRMVTSDFVCPSTTLHVVPGGLDLRGSLRVWRFKQRMLLRSIELPGAVGTMDVSLIPGDPKRRAYTAGMGDGHLYLADIDTGQVKTAFDFTVFGEAPMPQLMRITKDGSRLFVSLNGAGKVVMLDTSNPSSPFVLDALDLGAASGPHYIALTRDEKRLVIGDYFLNEDDFGKVHPEGDHKIHVASVRSRKLVLDPQFNLDFNTAFVNGPARPHGVAFK